MKGPQLSAFKFSITNQGSDSIDIHIDGYIVDSPSLEIMREYWGDETSVSYKSFRDSIPANVKTINLFVNCSGGHVGDAMAMRDHMASLEENGVTINREGRGIVASAGTYLVMGKNSRLSENCLFMIHEVSGFAYGDVSSMENQVKAMRKFNDLIVNFYSKETGLSSTVIGNMMKQETWLNADDAKEKGFVKAIGPKANLTNTIKAENWPFNNMAMLNTYNSFITNTNNPDMDTSKDTVSITDTIKNCFNALIKKLGLENKAEDETVTNAFKEFSENITNAIDNAKGPDNAAITKLVNDAVATSLKTIPENFSQAITDATKDMATKTDVTTTVNKGLENVITKADLTKEVKNLTDEVIKIIGGKSNPKDEGDSDQNNNNAKRKGPRNRFSGQTYWSQN